jgi:F420-non-reducing hydrogenase small subunit
VPEGTLELPSFDDSVKALDQVVPTDYYLPGCAPPVKLIVDAVMAIVKGELPPKGSVLAPDVALCHDCPRVDSKPDEPFITEFKRPHEILIDEEKCFLAQGLLCMGPATRCGCDHVCINGNMPCTGCLGPTSHVRDQGAAALSAFASLVASNEAGEIADVMDQIPDPAGTLYRYAVPASMLYKRVSKTDGNGGA